jgi:hypothetical protein
VLGFSFVFSGTVSAVFENAVFIFGVHAYDVGDVLYIDGQQLTVDEINMVGVDLDLDGQAPARRTLVAHSRSVLRSFARISPCACPGGINASTTPTKRC